ncbi:MAG: peptide ABC transporter substrate-binding protein [Desulfobacteraceae bacterium]|nr:peptide ABC transporter substrate-binding protein [Desulfobacteraceae bacterium]
MKRFTLIFAALFLAITLIPVAQVAAYRGEFIINNMAEPETLDPHLISGVPEHQIYMAISEGLMTYDPKTADPIPGLAESWKITNDGKTYTFKLRKTTWSDGVAITADTVVKSWLRMLDPKTAAPYAWFPSMFLAGAEDFNQGKAGADAVKIKALDDYTFQMELVGPLPYVLGALPHYSFAIVPLHVIEKHDSAWTNVENFVCNGPFKLETWEPQNKLTVVPNEKYWDKKAVTLKRIVFYSNDDQNTCFQMYENGESDWNRDIPIDQIRSVEFRDDFKVGPYLGTYYYTVQNEVPPFNDVRVRKALAMSINREELVKKISKAGEIATGAMVPKMAGYTAIDGNVSDLDKAKKLLADAGFPGGKGFPKFKILYNTNENHKKIAEYIQQEWSEGLGIDVELMNQEWKTYLATRRAGDFQVARAGWIGDYQDPNTFLDMFISGAAMNGGKYNSAEYDKLVRKAATMAAGNTRMDTLRKAEEIFIAQDQGVIPIYHYVTKNLIDTEKWGGWYVNTMDYHPMKHIYLK